MNSEELYIAFSFFVLVVASFLLVRNGVLFFFVKSVNAKYSRILADLLLTIAALRLQIASLSILESYLMLFLSLPRKCFGFLLAFVKRELPLFAHVYANKFLVLHALTNSSLVVFTRNCVKSRQSATFFGKFFDINL